MLCMKFFTPHHYNCVWNTYYETEILSSVFIHKMIVISCQVMTLGWYGDQMKARAAHSLFLREDVATPWTSFLFAGHAKCEHEH